mmetsp:Transcript_475/g.2234  ORF Transcript_475/g.2234 Transcript_475/m.2234 type:complete len:227 (+) Transcript_475:746-1426(+)
MRRVQRDNLRRPHLRDTARGRRGRVRRGSLPRFAPRQRRSGPLRRLAFDRRDALHGGGSSRAAGAGDGVGDGVVVNASRAAANVKVHARPVHRAVAVVNGRRRRLRCLRRPRRAPGPPVPLGDGHEPELIGGEREYVVGRGETHGGRRADAKPPRRLHVDQFVSSFADRSNSRRTRRAHRVRPFHAPDLRPFHRAGVFIFGVVTGFIFGVDEELAPRPERDSSRLF